MVGWEAGAAFPDKRRTAARTRVCDLHALRELPHYPRHFGAGETGPTLRTWQAGNACGRPAEQHAGQLSAWLHNPDMFKPGSHMPNLRLTDEQRGYIVQYLETLK